MGARGNLTVAGYAISSESEISIPPKFITSLDKGDPLHHYQGDDRDHKDKMINVGQSLQRKTDNRIFLF